MIPVSLKLSNFTSYGTVVPELKFTKFHLAVISGANGVGKSSILDAITWCVWGWSRAGDSSDQLVRLGADQMWVEFTFELDGQLYTVKRSRSIKHGGSTALELWSKTHNLTEGTIKATQQKIIDLLHLTIETFTNSSFLRQGHADEFTTKGPTDRKRILADILGLSHYDILEEKAKEKAKEAQTKLQLLQYQLLEIETELTQKDESEQKLKQVESSLLNIEKSLNETEESLKKLNLEKERLNLITAQRQKLEQDLKTNNFELADILKQGKDRAGRIQLLENDIKDLPEIEKKLANLSTLRKKLEETNIYKTKKLELERVVADVTHSLNLKKQNQEHLQNQLDAINNQLVDIEKVGAKCPTCGQEIGKEQRVQVKKELSDKKDLLTVEIKKIDLKYEETELKKANSEVSKLPITEDSNISSEIANLELLQTKKENLLKFAAQLETEKKTVIELRTFYKNKLEIVQEVEKSLSKIPGVEDKFNLLSQEISEKEVSLFRLRGEEKEARNIFGQVKELISRTEQLVKLQKTKQTEKESLENEKSAFEELALAFGKKGLQAMIIETAIPEVESEANDLLNRLTEGRMQVHFETLRESKTKMEDGEKGMIETLDIIISDEMGERPYEMYSGGEAFRVNFAIRLALSKLLTRRAGAKLQFLVIDEGFGTQDAPGRSRIVEVLDTIKKDFEKILVITHLDELKEEFPVRIEVVKGATGSSFEVIGA
ncbi:MAG: SMC family ATPase [Candidatus Daviesbacteria bacterium]|nr:SMC family ATPase [Candidatus Daviesbacteria bacterium]